MASPWEQLFYGIRLAMVRPFTFTLESRKGNYRDKKMLRNPTEMFPLLTGGIEYIKREELKSQKGFF